MKIQMYVQLDKENPGTGNIRGLNLAVVKPTTIQVSNCRFLDLNKLRHRLLHYPALTYVPVYIPYFNVTSGGKTCSRGTTIIKKVQPLPFYQGRNNKRRRKTKSLDTEQIYGHGSQRGSMPGVTVLAGCRE
jgi:hypothetical protein